MNSSLSKQIFNGKAKFFLVKEATGESSKSKTEEMASSTPSNR